MTSAAETTARPRSPSPTKHGRTVTLASLRGKVVLLTSLDPVCTSDCPLEVQESAKPAAARRRRPVGRELAAIVANLVNFQIGYTQAFNRQEGLAGVPSWLYLTGRLR